MLAKIYVFIIHLGFPALLGNRPSSFLGSVCVPSSISVRSQFADMPDGFSLLVIRILGQFDICVFTYSFLAVAKAAAGRRVSR